MTKIDMAKSSLAKSNKHTSNNIILASSGVFTMKLKLYNQNSYANSRYSWWFFQTLQKKSIYRLCSCTRKSTLSQDLFPMDSKFVFLNLSMSCVAGNLTIWTNSDLRPMRLWKGTVQSRINRFSAYGRNVIRSILMQKWSTLKKTLIV